MLQELKNWTDIHPNFTDEITKQWIQEGLNKEEAKEWLEILGIAKNISELVSHSSFFVWLRDKAEIEPSKFPSLSDDELKTLLKQYQEWIKKYVWCDGCKKRISKEKVFFSDREENIDFCSRNCENQWNVGGFNPLINFGLPKYGQLKSEKITFPNSWKCIHPDFTDELVKEWIKKDFDYEECKKWISTKVFSPRDVNIVYFLKKKGKTTEWALKNLPNDINNKGSDEFGEIKEELNRYLLENHLLKLPEILSNLTKIIEEILGIKPSMEFNKKNFKEYLYENAQESWFSKSFDNVYCKWIPFRPWKKEEFIRNYKYQDKYTVKVNEPLLIKKTPIIFKGRFELASLSTVLAYNLFLATFKFGGFINLSDILIAAVSLPPAIVVGASIFYFSSKINPKVYFRLSADESEWYGDNNSNAWQIAEEILSWSSEVYETIQQKKTVNELNSQLIELQQNETNSEISEIIIAELEKKLANKKELLVQKEKELKNSLRTSKKSTVNLRREIEYLKKMVDMKQALEELKEKSEIFKHLKSELVLKEKEVESIEEELEQFGYNKERGKRLREKESELTVLKKRLEELETTIMEQKRQLIINIGKIENHINQSIVGVEGDVKIGGSFSPQLEEIIIARQEQNEISKYKYGSIS